jgi:hypothetical protein
MPRKLEAIRWTIDRAAGEFPIQRNTLAKRLRAGGIEPGPDGKFSTGQICDATFGDLRGEQTRETKARADKLEIQNLRTLDRVIDKNVVKEFCSGVCIVLRREILASTMTDEEKDECLANIKKLLDEGAISKTLSNNGHK